MHTGLCAAADNLVLFMSSLFREKMPIRRYARSPSVCWSLAALLALAGCTSKPPPRRRRASGNVKSATDDADPINAGDRQEG